MAQLFQFKEIEEHRLEDLSLNSYMPFTESRPQKLNRMSHLLAVNSLRVSFC